MNQPNKSHSPAFTLLEILVSIVIVSILAALLVSGFSSYKTKSEGVVCSNSMKQIFQAIMQYAADNNNNLPFSAPGGQFWGDPLVNDGYLTTEFMRRACPSTARKLGYIGSIGYNYSVLGNTEPGAIGSVKTVSVGSLSKTCMLMDGHNVHNYFGLESDPNNVLRNGQQIVLWSKDFIRPDGQYFPVGHGNSLNIMFCDGHVELISKETFWDKDRASEIFQPSSNQPFGW